jgi:hypothetical protein
MCLGITNLLPHFQYNFLEMKKYLLFLVLALPLLAARCNKEEARGMLKLRILPKYGDQTLVMQERIIGGQNLPMVIKRLSFFLDLPDLGEELVLVDLSSLTSKAKAEEGYVANFDLLPGNYSNLRLGIGVPSDLNKKQPSDFSSSNPLSEVSEYWEAWDSYIFTKTEGAVDTAKNGRADLQFSYHTGTDEMFRIVTLNKNFTITENQNTEIVVELDGKAGVVNPLKEQNAHSLSNKAVALTISDNYLNSFKIK